MMGDPTKAAIILGLCIVFAAVILVYFSSYHSCMRWNKAHGLDLTASACIGR